MRAAAWWILLAYAFAVPWEYSLELGPPFGNAARLLGLLLLLAAVPAILEDGRLRRPGPVQWLALAFFLWVCCTALWSVNSAVTASAIRGYFQEILPVWLVWELARSPRHLRWLLRAAVAGSWVLALLTAWNLATLDAVASERIRFAAYGQDPNDVARFLDLSFPLAALLAVSEEGWPARILAWGYLPLGLAGVVLTASRGGVLAAAVAILGSAAILIRKRPLAASAALTFLPALGAILWQILPRETFERLATIPQQLQGGDFNLRLNIWQAGWHAFLRAPLFGHGTGTFVAAAGMAPEDTAHNTALSLAVGGGLVALLLAVALLAAGVAQASRTRGLLRLAFGTLLAVWLISSMVATIEENRSTWLLLALVALAGRLAGEDPAAMDACFDGNAAPAAWATARQDA